VISLMLSQAWVHRLGWTLLHFLWQGTAIVAGYAIVRRLLTRSLSARGRYGLACMTLMAMAAAPPVTFLLNPNPGGSRRAVMWTISAPEQNWLLPGVVALWLLGVIAFSVRLFGAWRFAARLRSGSQPAPAQWQHTLEQIAARMDAPQRVRLLVSSFVDVPTVIGWLRPAILVPVESFTGLPFDHLTALLAHEMAHIRRHDYLASILQSIAEAVLFYHPAVWWISGEIRSQRELCCDDLAVAASGDILNYACALAELESRRPSQIKPALAANDGSLVNRIRRLIEPAQASELSLPGAGAAWAMTLLWLAGAGVAAVHAAQPPAPASPAVTPSAIPRKAGTARPSPFVALTGRARNTLLYDPFLAAAQVGEPEGPPAIPTDSSPSSSPVQAPVPPLTQAQLQWYVPVTVQDAAGHVVTGLGKDAFRLFEDGVEQQISAISSAQDLFMPLVRRASVDPRLDEATIPRYPVSIGIVFDTTAEFDANLTHSRMAVEQLLKIISSPGDEVFLVMCGDQARLLRGVDEIRSQLPSLRASSGAAIMDGVSMALGEIGRARNERRMLWVISNGGQLPDVQAQYDVTRQILESGVEVAEVRSLQYPLPWLKCLEDTDCFVRTQILPEPRDGLVPRAPRIMPVSTRPNEAETLALLSRNEYRLEYTPKNTTRDGNKRTVEVRLAVPAALAVSFTVQYPKVYYAGFTCEHCPYLGPYW